MMIPFKISQSALLVVFGVSIVSMQTILQKSVTDSFFLESKYSKARDDLFTPDANYKESRSMQTTNVPGIKKESLNEKLYSQESTAISSEQDDNAPGLVWLASYPNSGTSYTLEVVRRSSDYAIATNYGKEASKHLFEESVPIHPSFANGPYKTNDRTREVPEKFVLTKTHCGSRCVRCPPNEYIETEESFLTRCLAAQPVHNSKSGKVELGEVVPYDADLVKRAVHIMRDPFDNIVSRFHHAHKIHRNDKFFQSNFPRDSAGFQAWCADMDSKYKGEERDLWGKELYQASKKVPCHSEFFRYVQWHNMAFAVMKKLDIPTLFLAYEDYAHNLDFNLVSILDFLELPMRNKVSEFHQGDYSAYYSDKQRVYAMKMMSIQASAVTWEKMKPYNYKVQKVEQGETVSS